MADFPIYRSNLIYPVVKTNTDDIVMETFDFHDMNNVVRRLFQEVDENHDVNNKRKRSSVFCALSPSPLREIPIQTNNTTTQNGLQPRQLLPEKENYHDNVSSFSTKQGIVSEVGGRDRTIPLPFVNQSSNPFPLNCSSKSPAEVFLNRLADVLSDQYPPDTNHMVLRDTIDVDFIPLNSLSETQIGTIRVMMIPNKRKKTMDGMGRLILGANFDRDQPNYVQGFWYSVLRSYDTFKQIYAAEKHVTERFDMLFGFSYNLFKNQRWLTHNGRGWGGEKMIVGLALRWKHVLKYSPEKIGLDQEFSYPAVLWFVEEFKLAVENAEMYGNPKLKFDYIM
ncbi:MAG: hypothetical protein ACI90V_003361 [Bacillariaceae sp.]|jgi:hypothetical protein